MKRLILINLLCLFLVSCTHIVPPVNDSNHLLRVAVVSCSKIQNVNPQVAWAEIEKQQPDLLLFVGDIVYLDKKHRNNQSMEDIFELQWQEPNFKQLISKVPYFAIWDDHDAGTNNIKLKTSYKTDRLRFAELYQEARTSYIKRFYNRDNLQLYKSLAVESIDIGGEQSQINNSNNFEGLNAIDYAFDVNGVQFIMLDGISSRTDPLPYKGKVLSEEQFAWLEKTLSEHKGLNFISTGASLELSSKDWGWKKGYPDQYRRLAKLLNQYKVVFLAGDIHKNATVKPDGKTTKFYELVSSGVANSDEKQGNYLILDIEKSALNKWGVHYHHRGPRMKTDYEKRSGKISFE